jgi:hypothetical protein
MAVLIGIIMGSAVALTVSLTMSAVVFLLLPEYWARLASERLPLLKALLWSWSLAAVAGASFIGELRGRHWRFATQLVLAAMLVARGCIFGPCGAVRFRRAARVPRRRGPSHRAFCRTG